MKPAHAAVPPRPFFLRLPALLVALALAAAWRGSEGDLAALFAPGARAAFADFAGGFWPPALSRDFLLSLARPAAETVAIATAGMTLASATRNLPTPLTRRRGSTTSPIRQVEVGW